MNDTTENRVVELIGEANFKWLSGIFNRESGLKDIPDEILERISEVDITARNYTNDKNAVSSIALITLAYKMSNRTQFPKDGPNDMLLLKVLAGNEILRRKGKSVPDNKLWFAPLHELIAGEVGDRIRKTHLITNPM